jgi:hypothetical protein
MCRVVEAIAARAAAGVEPWGTVHPMPGIAGAQRVHAIRNRLFSGKNCGILAERFGEISVSVRYRQADGSWENKRVPVEGAYVLGVAVYLRAAARSEIIGRVQRGEKLAFNPYKERA